MGIDPVRYHSNGSLVQTVMPGDQPSHGLGHGQDSSCDPGRSSRQHTTPPPFAQAELTGKHLEAEVVDRDHRPRPAAERKGVRRTKDEIETESLHVAGNQKLLPEHPTSTVSLEVKVGRPGHRGRQIEAFSLKEEVPFDSVLPLFEPGENPPQVTSDAGAPPLHFAGYDTHLHGAHPTPSRN